MSDASTDVRPKLLSPCHEATISASMADGVMVGSCSTCNENVVRMNPRTGVQEWLDDASPWAKGDLRPVADEYQRPEVLAFRPVLDLRSPCHDEPVVVHDYAGRTQVGACCRCYRIFVRINPATGRVERVESDDQIVSLAPLPEVEETFQPRR